MFLFVTLCVSDFNSKHFGVVPMPYRRKQLQNRKCESYQGDYSLVTPAKRHSEVVTDCLRLSLTHVVVSYPTSSRTECVSGGAVL